MSLYAKINDDQKKALKAQDAFSLGVLRMLASALKYKAIEKKADLTDIETIKILASEAKKRKDAFTAFTKGGRPELASREEKELAFIQKYLPTQLSEADVRKKIKEIIKANSGLAFGPLMGKTMKMLGTSAEGSLAQKILKEELSQ